MTPPSLSAVPPPPAAAVHWPGWGDKSHEVLRKKPIHRRQWFRRLVLTGGLAALTVGLGGGLWLLHEYRVIQANLARQRRDVEAFVRSRAFEAFAREADAQLVAALNFATLRPDAVGRVLPEIAAAEKARHQLPWSLELAPLPISTAEHPVRVQAALRTATDLLAGRGLAFDDARLAASRRVFLRLLTPHVRGFLADQPGAEFPALFLDRRLQDLVLAAYADRAGGTRDEAGHAFMFYSLLGPSLWQEIEVPSASSGIGR